MSEKILGVDSSDQPIASMERSEAVQMQHWRRASGGLVVDRSSQLLLCHQRSFSKDERPGLWVATFGGKNHPDEDPLSAAKRELFEEFGVEEPAVTIHFFDRIKSEERHQFEYLFIVFADAGNLKIEPDRTEVAALRWVPITEFLETIKTDENWYEYGYEGRMLTAADSTPPAIVRPSDEVPDLVR